MSPIAYCTVWFVIGILTYPHIAPFHAAVPFVVLCMSIICHQKTWRLGFVFCLSLLSCTGGQQWAKLKDPQQNPRHIAHQHDLQNKEFIADGSNYKSYIKRWEESCKSYGIKLHETSMEGAFTLNP